MATVRTLSTEPPKAVSVRTLSSEQIEAIEDATGVPANLWGSQGSTMRIIRLVLAAGNGVDPDSYKRMAGHELVALVSLDIEPESDPNP